MSSARAAELHMARGHRVPPPLRVGEAAARLEKRRQSMSTSAWSRIDAALRELVLIDGHVTRPGIWLLRFT